MKSQSIAAAPQPEQTSSAIAETLEEAVLIFRGELKIEPSFRHVAALAAAADELAARIAPSRAAKLDELLAAVFDKEPAPRNTIAADPVSEVLADLLLEDVPTAAGPWIQ